MRRRSRPIGARPNGNDGRSRLLAELFRNCGIGLEVFHLEKGGDPGSFRLIEANRAAARILGVRLKDLAGRTIRELPKSLKSSLPERYLEVLRTGRPKNLGEISREGKTIPQGAYSVRAFPLPNRCVGLALEDLTTQKHAEEAFRAHEEQFRLLVGSVKNYAIFMLDVQGNILTWNAGAERIKGYRADEVLGKNISMFYARQGGRSQKVRKSLREAAGKGWFKEEGWRVRKDGSRFWASVTITPLRDKAGRLRGFAKVTCDVTDRMQAEATVRSLIKISAELNSTLNLEGLLDALIRESVELAGAESGCAGLMTEKGMVTSKYYQKGAFLSFDYCWPPGHGLPGWLILHKTPYITNDALGDRQIMRDLAVRFGVRSAVCTPVLDSRGKVMAFFQVYNKRDAAGFCQHDVEMLAAVSQSASAAIQNALAYMKIREAERALRELSGQLLRSQDDERRRIARELHDSIGQNATALALNLSVLRDSTQRMDSKAQGALANCISLVTQTSREIRTFSYVLHPPLLDEEGLESALDWLIAGFSERSRIRVRLNVSSRLGRLSRDQETAIFRIVQESLTNIHRHSGSRTASVRLEQRDGAVRLKIRDAGRGMDPRTIEKVERGGAGLGVGISGMYERIRELGGTLNIKSGGGGTTVQVQVPLSEVQP